MARLLQTRPESQLCARQLQPVGFHLPARARQLQPVGLHLPALGPVSVVVPVAQVLPSVQSVQRAGSQAEESYPGGFQCPPGYYPTAVSFLLRDVHPCARSDQHTLCPCVATPSYHGALVQSVCGCQQVLQPFGVHHLLPRDLAGGALQAGVS